MEPTGTFHGCTITTKAYIAHARVLAKSFRAHNPAARFSALIVDASLDEAARDREPFEVLAPAHVGIEEAELDRRATMYTAQGLACSLKPILLLALLARDDRPVLYLDADGCVYSDLRPLAEACEESALLLSPHMLDPYPLIGLDGPEQIILRVGVFNAGLLGVGAGAEEALRWWSQRTARRCVFDERAGLVFDQTWLTLMPLFFASHRVLRDRGCNVAGWNLHTRDVAWDRDRPLIEGQPLRHFHFAGSFDPHRPETITPIEHLASWWATLAQRPGAARLVREYAQRLIEEGYHEARASPPQHDLMPDGAPILPWMRESYRTALLQAEESGAPEPPNPFAHGPQRFREWIRQRAREAARSGVQEPCLEHEALTEALLDSRRLFARITELEGIRDDAIGWAQRVSAELQDASRRLEQISSERDEVGSARDEASRERDEIASERDAVSRERDEIAFERDRVHRELESEREQSAALVESIRRSASWRVTKPLRQAQAALKRGAGDLVR